MIFPWQLGMNKVYQAKNVFVPYGPSGVNE
jgi:hypothetical protein